MPVHWTISHPQRLVVAITKEQVTVSDIEQHFGRFPRRTSRRWAIGFYAKHRQIGPVAIVAASDESFAQAQAFAQAAAARRPLQIFRELHVARQWLDTQAVPEG